MLKATRSLQTGEQGYTLIELLVVLAVMALLIAATPAIVSAARPGAEARAATYALANALRGSRSAAIIADEERDVLLNLESRIYISDGKTHELPRGVTWTFEGPAQTGDDDQVLFRFFPDGSSTGGHIQIVGAGQKRTIVAQRLTGRISVDE